jgi:hypothetical protein
MNPGENQMFSRDSELEISQSKVVQMNLSFGERVSYRRTDATR